MKWAEYAKEIIAEHSDMIMSRTQAQAIIIVPGLSSPPAGATRHVVLGCKIWMHLRWQGKPGHVSSKIVLVIGCESEGKRDGQ